MPRQSTRVPCICQNCGQPFETTAYRVADGRGKFCSKPCSDAAKRVPFEVRLAAYDRAADDCWLWNGNIAKSGYGQVSINNQPQRAHRVAFEIAYGPIPDGMLVLHACDNPACVRNDGVGVYFANGAWHPRRGHLWLGTSADNTADMLAKGRAATGEEHWSRQHPERLARGDRSGPHVHPERMARGEANGFAKLTAESVREIRARYAAGDMSGAQIAHEYGIGTTHFWRIVKREVWRHIE